MNTADAGKERLSVVIVDSGLGGLSIFAGIVKGLLQRRLFKQVTLTYFNAWPDQHRGYNALGSQAARIRAFDAALAGVQAFDPHIVFLACNTLSVLYPQTAFSRTAGTPVVGIVDFGVGLMLDHLRHLPESQVIILGTVTTIASAIHRDSLISHGIDGRRIVSQPCDQLATRIEHGPDSPRVRAMIDDFLVQAASKLYFPDAPVAAAFCCTHFGYSSALFQSSLDAIIGPGTTLLNPNDGMVSHFFKLFKGPIGSEMALELKIVSKIKWSDGKVHAIAGALKPISPETSRALLDYRHDPELFTI